jgi:hypothetical protein
MLYSSEGVLSGDDGGELARVEALPSPALARLLVGADSYEIEKPGALGWHFQLLDERKGVVYDFKPGLRRGGTMHSGGGEEIAKLHKALVGTHWTLTPGDGGPIEVKRREGLVGPVVSDDGQIVAPALDLAVPATVPVDAGLTRLLAFTCWLIEEWDGREPF